MLIDVTYFVAELNIPNTDRAEVVASLDIFIKKYEPKYLEMLLGEIMYAEYVAGTTLVPIDPDADPVEYEPIDQKWIDLENKLRDPGTKVSPIANYIYFFICRDAAIDNSGIGMTLPVGENSTRADSKIKTSRAWNEMNELSYSVYKFLRANVGIYGPTPYHICFRFPMYANWSLWWDYYGYQFRNRVPEIFIPINPLNI